MSYADLIAGIDSATRSILGGVAVTYTTAQGESAVVTGLFDDRYLLISPSQSAVEQLVPAVFLRLSELPADPYYDDPTIEIAGNTYRVRERQPDGQVGGGVILVLQRISSVS